MNIESKNADFEARNRSGNVFQGRTVIGVSASNDDSSDLAEGFLLFRPVLAILCASATARGRVGRGVYGCVAKRKCVTRLVRVDYHAKNLPPLSYRTNNKFRHEGHRNIDFGSYRQISWKEFRWMFKAARNLTGVVLNVLPLFVGHNRCHLCGLVHI